MCIFGVRMGVRSLVFIRFSKDSMTQRTTHLKASAPEMSQPKPCLPAHPEEQLSVTGKGWSRTGPDLSPCGWPTMPRVAFNLHHRQVWNDCVFFKYSPLFGNARAGAPSGCRRELMPPMTAGDGRALWRSRSGHANEAPPPSPSSSLVCQGILSREEKEAERKGADSGVEWEALYEFLVAALTKNPKPGGLNP